MPLVTVIVPNYNHSRFLQRRIDSILEQTFQELEIIILDDASTDNSREVIENYRYHPKVKAIVYNEQNSGSPFNQWKKGIELAKSEWIWIAESDDYCEPEFLEAMIPVFGIKACVLAYSEISWVDENGKMLKPGIYKTPFWIQGKEFLRKYMYMGDYLVNAGMVIFQKTAYKAVAPDWQKMKQAGDYWFWCEVARQGIVYACGKPLAYFVRHSKSVSASLMFTFQHWDEHMMVLDRLQQLNVISKPELREYIIHKLIALETSKKANSKEFYLNWFSYWQKQLADRGFGQAYMSVSVRTFLRKLSHFTFNKLKYLSGK